MFSPFTSLTRAAVSELIFVRIHVVDRAEVKGAAVNNTATKTRKN